MSCNFCCNYGGDDGTTTNTSGASAGTGWTEDNFPTKDGDNETRDGKSTYETILKVPVAFRFIHVDMIINNNVVPEIGYDSTFAWDTLIPEVNKIWEPAGIKFVEPARGYSSRDEYPIEAGYLFDKYITTIQNTNYSSQKARLVNALEQITVFGNPFEPHPGAVLINVFPAIGLPGPGGGTLQGLATVGRKKRFHQFHGSVCLSGILKPEKRILVLAHELGHILGLRHPPDGYECVDCLMNTRGGIGPEIPKFMVELARKTWERVIESIEDPVRPRSQRVVESILD